MSREPSFHMKTAHHSTGKFGWLLGVLLLLGVVLQTAGAQQGEPLRFEDPALEQAIRGQLADSGPEQLYADDVSGIESLALEWPEEDGQIHSLEGIQALTGLTYLNLRGNSVADMSPLANLENLAMLDLQQNNVTHIPAVGGLMSLSELNLAGNQLSDISGLAALTRLEYLNLSDNQVSDVSSLAELEYLMGLALQGNNISDVSPLTGLPDLFDLTLFDNKELDLCTDSPARVAVDELLDLGVDVLYQEYATGGAACPEMAGIEPLRILKTVAGQEESIHVQGGKLARLNPDGTRVTATCQGSARIISLVNEDKGVYWSGLFGEFTRELSRFIPVQLLPDDPEARSAVQVQVREAGNEELLGHDSQHYLVNWRPDAEEGGDEQPWQPLQELWVSPAMTEALEPGGCQEPAMMLEYYQLAQSTFSAQRFYGVSGSRDYGLAVTSGFPVRSTTFGPGDTEPVETEVTAVDSQESAAELFMVPETLQRVNSIGQVF